MMGLWYFRPLFLAERGRLLATLFLSILTLLAGVMLLGTSGWFLTAAATTTAAATFNLFVPSSLVRGLSLVRILSRYGEKLTGHDTTLRLLTRIRTWLFAQLFPRLPFDDRGIRHGDLVSRLTADVESLDSAFLVALGPLLTALIMGLAMTALLLVLLPAAGLVYAAAYLLALVAVPAGLLLAGRRCGQEVVEEAAELRIQALDGIDGHAELIAFGTVPSQDERFSRQARRLSRARLRQAQLGTLGTATIQALAGSVLLGVLWLGLDALQKDTLSGPMLVGLLLACLGSFEALAGVVRGVAKFGSAAAAADRLVATATAAPAVADPGMPVTLNPGSLSFEAVYYGYDPARPVLKGLDLRLEEGQRVAIVGASGTGKSTLADLALRLRDPQRGTVRIGGVDLRAMRQADLHRHVALLSQTAPVFLGTIRDNLAIGRSGASDAELWQALDEARLGDFVRGLPEALDTHLGEAGRTLSVGQARRLCLARTLLSPASILIFDEPTMGLDPETEQGFLTDLSHATRGRSVLLITHARLPAGAVDAVWRLVDGRLTEVR